MATPTVDKGRFPPTLWRALRGAGLEPAKVLRAAGLASTLHLDSSAAFSTAQLFAVWKAVEILADDAALALATARSTSAAVHTGIRPISWPSNGEVTTVNSSPTCRSPASGSGRTS